MSVSLRRNGVLTRLALPAIRGEAQRRNCALAFTRITKSCSGPTLPVWASNVYGCGTGGHVGGRRESRFGKADMPYSYTSNCSLNNTIFGSGHKSPRLDWRCLRGRRFRSLLTPRTSFRGSFAVEHDDLHVFRHRVVVDLEALKGREVKYSRNRLPTTSEHPRGVGRPSSSKSGALTIRPVKKDESDNLLLRLLHLRRRRRSCPVEVSMVEGRQRCRKTSSYMISSGLGVMGGIDSLSGGCVRTAGYNLRSEGLTFNSDGEKAVTCLVERSHSRTGATTNIDEHARAPSARSPHTPNSTTPFATLQQPQSTAHGVWLSENKANADDETNHSATPAVTEKEF
ncbi:hypothetical protein DFP72DRAFT_851150 [Ephemerocybe angulata]|uniref:Uncharacterized protein n=1 Tax=Ephemerocybe angulata TaxID=980116 RepID=A0A8H6M1R5_9AGAR|nr:hypothetical protein DFP72DRAFT_851150 [Tulosesus angulatus]